MPDQQKTEEFVHKLLTDVSASMTVMLAAIGDRLGLFKDMAEGGPATSEELAERTDIKEWVPAMPVVQSRLESGVSVADVGCGRGRALIRLAEAFPNSTFMGYDVFAPTIEKATRAAREAGVDDRVRFQQLEVSQGIPRKHDIITTFDVVHDAVDPLGMLRDIHQALSADGVHVCLDVNCSDKLEENAGPMGSLFHGFSIFYCMTTSLANGGVGLGALGLPEPKVKELCTEAGFSSVRTVPLDNPFNNLYEIRP